MKCGAPYTNLLLHLHMECYRCKFWLYMQTHCSLHKCGASHVYTVLCICSNECSEANYSTK